MYKALLFVIRIFFSIGGKVSLRPAMFISSLPNIQTLLLVTFSFISVDVGY